jgi:hypothetical protein
MRPRYPTHACSAAVPVVPGQTEIAGKLLAPYSRDFLAFVAK